MCRIEEEQSFEELKILRELVHDRFYKQEELAEVRNLCREGHLVPAHPKPFSVDMLVFLSEHMATSSTSQHLSLGLHVCLFMIGSRVFENRSLILREPHLVIQMAAEAAGCCSTCSPGFQGGAAGMDSRALKGKW